MATANKPAPIPPQQFRIVHPAQVVCSADFSVVKASTAPTKKPLLCIAQQKLQFYVPATTYEVVVLCFGVIDTYNSVVTLDHPCN